MPSSPESVSLQLPGGTPVIDLNDGTTIPQLAFGVFRVPDHDATPALGQ
jgi:hypothetical protein